MTNHTVGDRIPMDFGEMLDCLRELCEIPVVLRKEGTASVKCPHFVKKHVHVVEGCNEDDWCNGIGIGIVIGERHFVPECRQAVLVFTVCITVIAVFADAITGVSKVRKVSRVHTVHE